MISTSNLDNSVSSPAGDQAVARSNVSVDETLLFQVAAAIAYIKCNLELLRQCQQSRALRGGGKRGRGNEKRNRHLVLQSDICIDSTAFYIAVQLLYLHRESCMYT